MKHPAHEAANREAAAIILADPERYGGTESGLCTWARRVTHRGGAETSEAAELLASLPLLRDTAEVAAQAAMRARQHAEERDAEVRAGRGDAEALAGAVARLRAVEEEQRAAARRLERAHQRLAMLRAVVEVQV